MRTAFFGGSFDPPHRGHIAVARAAKDRLALDQVLFAPAAAQPLKDASSLSSYADRLAMVELAVRDEPGFLPSDLDAPLPGGEPNYTADTLRRLRTRMQPADELFCLVGADSFLTLKAWHRSSELLLLANFIIAGRPGFALAQITQALPAGIMPLGEQRHSGYIQFALAGSAGHTSSLYLLPDLKLDVSATEVRTAVAEGEDPRNLLPPAVAAYIRRNRLYQPS